MFSSVKIHPLDRETAGQVSIFEQQNCVPAPARRGGGQTAALLCAEMTDY